VGRTCGPAPTGVEVGVRVGVGGAVNVAVGAGVSVPEGVAVGDLDGWGVPVAVAVAVALKGIVAVADGARAGVHVEVALGVRVGVGVSGRASTVRGACGGGTPRIFAVLGLLLRPSGFVMMTMRGPGGALGSAESDAASDSPFWTKSTRAVTPPPTVSVAPGRK